MVNCKNCGAEASESAGFCPKCGDEMGCGKPTPRQIESRKNPEYRLLTAMTGGLSILWLGALIFMAAITVSSLVTWSNFFAWFLVGHGALLVLKFIVNQVLPTPVRAKHGYLIGGAVTTGIGALFLAGLGNYFWPVVITGLGIYVVSMGILKFYRGNGHNV